MSDEETKNDKSDEETEETTETKSEKAEQRTERRESSSQSPPRSRSTTTTSSHRRDGPPPTKLYIGNLPDNCKRSELTELFEKFGEIEKCDVLRNFAFVVSFGYSCYFI